jgi:DNA-binding IscR family transcriptional regulator
MRISKSKKEKISEQILNYLFLKSPKAIFTSYIAQEIARDEEFTLKLLNKLKEKGLVIEINKNKEGKTYLRRKRWKLSDQIYSFYRSKQDVILEY